MTIKVGINGVGRMGRLTLRAAVDLPSSIKQYLIITGNYPY